MEWELLEIQSIRGADYNPRVISDTSFQRLQDSLRVLGCIRPIIVNQNNVIIAGHQRSKALNKIGLKKIYGFKSFMPLKKKDEILFNLLHNSIDTSTTKLEITIPLIEGEYNIVHPEDILIKKKGNGSYLKEICKLLVRYGEFDGAIFVNENLILNSDYLYALKILGYTGRIYVVPQKLEKQGQKYLTQDYGEYDYGKLDVHNYNQQECQPNRASNNRTIWDKINTDNLQNKRILDFGAGKKREAKQMKQLGYNVFAYEPYISTGKKNTYNISQVKRDINTITKDVKNNGLYDIIILNSVLNSVTNDKYEHSVLLSCNALLKDDGEIYIATRKQPALLKNSHRDSIREIQFFDKNGYSAAYTYGKWTLQKYYKNKEEFKKTLLNYFQQCKVTQSVSERIDAYCKYPRIDIPENEKRKALNTEFNLEYPHNYHHNMHHELVNQVLLHQ